jgi:very-long-chain (3R)-3-hydroxyacyl-CoA dehydratase
MASYLRKTYLIAYNAASAVAWATVLGRVLGVLYVKGNPGLVPVSVDTFVRNTQTFAVLEILHSLLGLSSHRLLVDAIGMLTCEQPGIVPSPLFTTVMQVASRLVLMWGVTYPFPEVTVSPWYSSMLIAWSLTEVIRYTYFAIKEAGMPIPYWLHWLRYSAFSVLYPVGISSELAEMYLSWNGPSAHRAEWYPWAIAAVASTYIYGE